MENRRVVIKKYANRRLYDTYASRYVNLDDIAALVRNGKDVQVVDARTKQDLTRVVLTQIIVEDAKGRPSALPLELLKQLVMATDHVRQEFMAWYLKSAFDNYHTVQSALQDGLVKLGSAVLSPLDAVRQLLPNPVASTNSEELERLRRRISELESELRKSRGNTRKTAATKNH
ncbi:MAG TPA: polyhydroxyalkanoate synthesis regulator DNA-binding domain-containing protein [Terriglobales bacterium]|nr:polyhydroxyalkanoate synthesis regulator DNA-binding domain-containing protein [Terriglobales bacterium]